MRILQTCALLLVLTAVGAVRAGEWASWRGPDQNGVSSEVGLISDWSTAGKNLVWHAELIGRSTPVVLDGQVCGLGRVGEGGEKQEIVACFDAETGAKRWEHRFNVYNTTVPFQRVGWANLVADPESGRLYAHGVAGQLNCYERDGEIVWSRFLVEELGRASGYGGRTQTPLIDGDQLILSFVNHGFGSIAGPRHRYYAFDKRTGEILWVSAPGGRPYDMNTQSGCVVAEIDEQRLLVCGNADGHVYAMQVATGEKVWEFELSHRGLNSAPLVVGDRVFISHSEENVDDPLMGRLVAIDGTGRGDVTKTHELWRINEFAGGFPSPTYKDGKLYTVDNSANLFVIDAASGKILTSHALGTVGKASPVLADGKIYVAETNGRTHILRETDEDLESLSMVEIALPEGRYAEIYGSPAPAYGRVFLATEGGIYCLGDKEKKIEVVSKKRDTPKEKKVPEFKGQPAQIRIVPAIVAMTPGQQVPFRALAFDASGKRLGRVKAEWALDGLVGTIDARGNFLADPDLPFQAGSVTAKVEKAEGRALARVVASPPWEEDFESAAVGRVPSHWVGARGLFEVRQKDGGQVLTKLNRERGLLRNATFIGSSDSTGYTIEADLMGAQRKRRLSDIGLINGGYTLDLQGNKQRIQIRSWPSEERMARDVDFAWEMGVWYRAMLRVDVERDKALIRGKVWKKGEPEPEAWTITVEDPLPIRGGSPGLIGYSPADIHFDNVRITVNQ